MKELVVSDNVFAYLKPTVVVLKFFGLAPIVYRLENGSYILRKSKTYIVYSYTIALCLAIWAFVGLWMDATSEFSFRVKNKNDIYVTLSDIGGVILSVLIGILLGPVKVEDLFEIIRCLDNISKLLNDSFSVLEWDKYNSLFFIFAVYTISTLVLFLDLYSWSERTSTTQLSVDYVKYYLSFYLFYFVLISQQLTYNNLSLHVKRRVTFLNLILAEEIVKRTEEKEKEYIFWIKMEEKGIVERFFRNNKVKPYSKGPSKIKAFPEVYEEIQNCIQAINKFFDYPLMIILVTCFIHMIITIWGILVSYYTRWLFLFMNILWIFIQTGRLVFVIEPVHQCLFEMSKTKPLVAKLVATVDGKEMNQELNIIVNLMKTPCQQFTAAGLVTLRRPILSTMAGAITTYLVILYQLHSAKRVN